MAIDESTTIKTPTAKRTKNIIGLGKIAKIQKNYTGSPVTNPLDLYTQCEFLDPNIRFTYITLCRYAEMKTMHLRADLYKSLMNLKI